MCCGVGTSTGALTFKFRLLCLDTNVGEATETPSICEGHPCADAARDVQRDSKQIKICAKQNNTLSMTMCKTSAVPAGAQQTTKHLTHRVIHEIPLERRGNKREGEDEIHGLKPKFPHTPAPRHDGTKKHKNCVKSVPPNTEKWLRKRHDENDDNNMSNETKGETNYSMNNK